MLPARDSRWISRILATAVLLVLAGCDADLLEGPGVDEPDIGGDPTAGDVWMPAPGTTWQWQLQGNIDTSVDVDVVDVDLFDTSASVVSEFKAQGRRVIAYFSAGSMESWRPDADGFPSGDVGRPLDGWPGERWIDVRSADVRAIMEARMDLAVTKGFDAVEPDNVDGYQNGSGFPLSSQDQMDYLRFLAAAAHNRGLSIGLKNSVELVAQAEPFFDWAINEECLVYDECDMLRPFLTAGKAVFHVEYANNCNGLTSRAGDICGDPTISGFSTLVKTLDLGACRAACGPAL